MCGIVGIAGLSEAVFANEHLVDLMCREIRHRGPDDQGIYVHGPVGLGMRRLSIIDLHTGHQPICNEDKTVWVVFNGEIYNFHALKHQLEARGHVFQTQTDTEVIVHLYEEHGADCVQHLRGMFAAAVWNDDTRELLLMRDRIGQKPLFYTVHHHRLLFGSEIKALLAYPGVPRELEWAALDQYLTYGYVPAPATMFRGIYKLPPAHVLICRNGQTTVRPYWRVEYQANGRERSEAEYVDEAQALLQEAVELRMSSDVPLGAFLSGGLDSSVIVGLMSACAARPVKTFSIGFSEKTYSELGYARTIARHFQTEHYEFEVTPNALEIIERLVWHFDEPFADSSAIPMYYVSKCARQHVTVALSGDGGDELFAGYRRYVGRKLSQAFNRLPRGLREHVLNRLIARLPEGAGYTGKSVLKKLKRFVEQAADAERYPYSSRLPVLSDDLKALLSAANGGPSPEAGHTERSRGAPFAALRPYFEQCAALDPITQMLWVDLQTYLPDDILTKVDKMSMAVSLEARSPLLDHVLIEYLARVPTGLKLRGLTTKYLLKKVAERFVPHQIINRPKQGFVVPIAAWFKHEMRDYLHDTLLSATARQRGLFNASETERLIVAHQRGQRDHSQELWALLMFELWLREFLDAPPLRGV